jgi:hypothetical protein
MQTIPLSAIPNQDITVTFGSRRWTLTIKEANGVMVIDLALNEVALLTGQRIVCGSPVIPYKYMQTNGNFWLITENDELPDYRRFGIDQTFVFVEPGELPNG